MNLEQIEKKLFEKLNDNNYKTENFNFIDNFIEKNKTKTIQEKINDFEKYIKTLNINDFIILLSHSGHIPDFYKNSSSIENLHTKLNEILVCYAFKLIGFKETFTPSQKTSKEDITILDKENLNLLVCDVKSFRMGRSQKNPNTKDMVKKSDVKKWLNNNNQFKEYKKLGGLLIAPSTHTKGNSLDLYQELTDYNSPIVLLNYEHLAFLLFLKENNFYNIKEKLISLIQNYKKVFPESLDKNQFNNKKIYFNQIEDFLFDHHPNEWEKFKDICLMIINNKIQFLKDDLMNRIIKNKEIIFDQYSKMDFNQENFNFLKNELINLKTTCLNEDLELKLSNMLKHR